MKEGSKGADSAESEGRDPIQVIGGTSLRVYLTLLSLDKPVGIRELQRILGFKSPSTARHHLERLVDLGLVERSGGGYRAKRPREGLLTTYMVVKGRLLPRLIVTASFTLGLAVAYTLYPGSDPIASLALFVAGIIQFIEAARLWFTAKRLVTT
ncbi:MAG: ArsR family transcriptional regulator [Desulfurococcales archaeon]|nr:ArsR family transcriptional regulator [Desulfurococcales archaeon]